ncbi:Uncharacterised protein [Bordetella ansorpii]|uniref:Uncharacterized protein n=1 Tax=Bordetella ansorpii TaxID=288768 RepID=A0A157S915_9BORD|nr:hypothetical protein [Bordetella ansorpii]SAI37238.1 Uncharacterised protein [Bordetella ansorpii]SAI66879.1 Uncharacterised protein [Bordetella ansorpii]
MSDTDFPFGNDLMRPEDWVGTMGAKSRRWLISYEGSLAVVCGYHSFIFLGLDSMAISVVNILNCGVTVSAPIGKIFKAVGGSARDALAFEKVNDLAGDAKQIDDAVTMEREQAGANSGMALYERMKKAIPQLVYATKPFSFDDLAGMPGGIAGAEIEAVGAAGIYRIEGYNGVKGGFTSDFIFQATIANTGTGLVAGGLGVSAGVWSVEGPKNLYWELAARSRARCVVENSAPSYDQPYRQIPNLHPYLQGLPPAGCKIEDTHFNPARLMQQPIP